METLPRTDPVEDEVSSNFQKQGFAINFQEVGEEVNNCETPKVTRWQPKTKPSATFFTFDLLDHFFVSLKRLPGKWRALTWRLCPAAPTR